MKYNTLIHGDCVKVIRKFPDACIDLTVTSPPYGQLRDYEGYSFDFDQFKILAAELYRVTKKGGVVVWVVGDAISNKSETFTSLKQALFFKEIGLLAHDTMIYEKSGFAYPSKNRYHQIFEYMFVFVKGDIKTFNPIKDHICTRGDGGAQRRQKDGTMSSRKNNRIEYPEIAMRRNIWRYKTGRNNTTRDNEAYEHPALMPDKLARDHILSWSNKGDVVFDPFAGCYDDKTEILTENGFKLFKNLKKERVATLENGELKYEYPQKYQCYDYDGEMYRIKHRSIDLLITPNHKLYYKAYRGNKYILDDIQNIKYKVINLTANCNWKGKYQEWFVLPFVELDENANYIDFSEKTILMDDWLEFLGYFLSDGSTTINKCSRRIYLHAVKKRKVEKYRAILDKLPFKYYRRELVFEINNKQLYTYLKQFGKAKDKFIPKNILNLCKEQLYILFNALIEGDGNINESRSIYYYTISNRLRDNLQELSLKIGKASTFHSKKRGSSIIDGRTITPKYPCNNMSIRNGKELTVRPIRHFSKEHYNGKVYCVTVPSHVIFVRRNGRSIWCGNSGTTLKMADALQRKYIGIEISRKYCQLIQKRLNQTRIRLT